MAANPCPCGQYGARDAACTCSAQSRRRYLARLSGPLVDRIDMQLRVARIASAQFRLAESGEVTTVSTADARERVLGARARARERLRATPWSLNAEVPGQFLRSGDRRLDASRTGAIDRALELGTLTMRGYDRVLRLAWTLADLDGADRPDRSHVSNALALRRSL
ncbi:ATP-binding protein [Frondihabitans australicus]|uniref:magnesium chelatase subunit ChlI family protein n=1 Tax=Frondihabitans australicus TaxID=386892 RepID=UPI000EAEA68F|nr:ATP-binding protein [Frondihabitans australicus]